MLEKLNEYKEILTIIVFFLGGYSWLQNQYPNKEYLKTELTSLRCQLDHYMKLTQLQIKNQELDKDVSMLSKTLSDNSGKGKVSLSPAMQMELSEKLGRKKEDQKSTLNEMERINNDLIIGNCGRVGL